MSGTLNVLAIPGSLRVGSYNRALLRAAQELAPTSFSWSTFDLRSVPFFDGDVEAAGAPPEVQALWQAVRAADLLVIASPEYNHGPPGVLKNTLDWASRARPSVLASKPVLLMGASTGLIGTARAQIQLRENLAANGAAVLTGLDILVGRAQDKFDAEGRLTDGDTRTFLKKALVKAETWAFNWQDFLA